MKILAISAAILLAACVAQPPARQDRRAEEPPMTPVQRDITALVSFFTGNWDPRPGEPPVRLRVTEFWKGSPARWLYLEWVPLSNDSRPTRQLVFRIAEENQRMTTTVHRLPGDPARFAGEWRKARPFGSIRPEELRDLNCRLDTRRNMIAFFVLATEGTKCPGDLAGAPFMRFEFSLRSTELSLLEQPRDAAGNVPPSRLEPFQFMRVSDAPK